MSSSCSTRTLPYHQAWAVVSYFNYILLQVTGARWGQLCRSRLAILVVDSVNFQTCHSLFIWRWILSGCRSTWSSRYSSSISFFRKIFFDRQRPGPALTGPARSATVNVCGTGVPNSNCWQTRIGVTLSSSIRWPWFSCRHRYAYKSFRICIKLKKVAICFTIFQLPTSPIKIATTSYHKFFKQSVT